MRPKFLLAVIMLFFLAFPGMAYSCGDNEYEQCWSVNLVFGTAKDCKCLPKIGGDVGKVAEDVKKTAAPVIEEIRKSPDAVVECLGDVGHCVMQILAAPLAAPVQVYLDGLYKQSEGKLRVFSKEFIALAQPYFDVDLRGITYADDIDTGMDMNVSYCDRIFFIGHGNPWTDKKELRLMLHELEHTIQCQRRGKSVYLAEYVLKAGMDVIKTGRLDVHDVIDYEVAADAKANQLTDKLWNKIMSGWVPIPGQPTMSPASLKPLTYCQTPMGACGISPVMLPAGTSCYCNTMSGSINGSAF